MSWAWPFASSNTSLGVGNELYPMSRMAEQVGADALYDGQIANSGGLQGSRLRLFGVIGRWCEQIARFTVMTHHHVLGAFLGQVADDDDWLLDSHEGPGA